MTRHFHSPRIVPQRIGPVDQAITAAATANSHLDRAIARMAGAAALAVLLATGPCAAQVLTIDTSGKGKVASTGPVDRRYAQIEPTHVDLSKTELDPKTRMELIRSLDSEHGFAMRPLPRGHKGLTLAANGKLEPAGESYLSMVTSEGLSAKPGSQVVITDVKFDRSKIVFDFDGGPDAKHRFLRHLQIGVGPTATDPSADANMDPTLADSNGEPAGSRLTLTFADHVPELTPAQVKALIAPLISFDVKSPVQAFTDTLPKELKDAILGHKVLVGMTTDMVLFAMGQPLTRTREMDGQMPFEEWIYGTPPEDVKFVRINGNRVIRLEIAKDGQPLQIFTKDVVTAMMTTDSQSTILAQATSRTIREGDTETDPNRQAPAAPPSLRKPGESLPDGTTSTGNPGNNPNVGVMRPVQFPKPHADEQPGANPDEQPSTPASSEPSQSAYPQPAAQGNGQSTPSNSSQSGSPAIKSPAAPAGSSQPPGATSQLVGSSSSTQPN